MKERFNCIKKEKQGYRLLVEYDQFYDGVEL